MIDWTGIRNRLDRLARRARPGTVLSVTAPLRGMPAALPTTDEWIFWQRPDEELRLLGIGAALRVETGGPGRFAALNAAMRGLQQHWHIDAAGASPPLALAGFAFAPEGGDPLPNATLMVPAVLLREVADQADITFSCAVEDAANAVYRWQTLLASLNARHEDAPPHLERAAMPLADLAFLARGRAALAAIDAGRQAKLVLTRGVRLTAERTLRAAPTLAALADQNPDCTVWAVAHSGKVFLGASPERLLTLREGRVEVDALAGTAWTTGADGEPASLSLADDKNRREHELVVGSVHEALAPLCETLSVPEEAEIMHLHQLSHLRRRIVGQVRPGMGPFDLIARLHPTPAVGGVPTASALQWLGAHNDRRGAWYTGGIGWIDAEGDADFVVALRCGLLDGKEATLYAGAGFVAGSDPPQELAETEAKLAPMLSALRATQACRERGTGT
jgi:isochorismate synthase